MVKALTRTDELPVSGFAHVLASSRNQNEYHQFHHHTSCSADSSWSPWWSTFVSKSSSPMSWRLECSSSPFPTDFFSSISPTDSFLSHNNESKEVSSWKEAETEVLARAAHRRLSPLLLLASSLLARVLAIFRWLDVRFWR